MPRRIVVALVAVAAAAAGLAVVYGVRIDTGLYYDDFFLVRPWSAPELRRVLYGSWDPTGVSVLFFRPVTAWLYAARFELFGLNSAAMHGVSLAGHGLCALLAAWFVRREGGGRWLAWFTAWLYAIHPALPYGHASWLTNQMHLAQSVVVLSALLIWQAVRDRRPVWWAPLVLLAAIAFLIKEDGIMLLPALGALTVLRAWIGGGRLPKHWAWLAASGVAAVAALVAFRYTRIGQLGGYGEPNLDQAITNLSRGIRSVLFLWPTASVWRGGAAGIAVVLVGAGIAAGFRPWHERRLLMLAGALIMGAIALEIPVDVASGQVAFSPFAWPPVVGGIAVATLVIGLGASVAGTDRRALWLISAGVLILLSFNLPFFLVSKREQFHLLALGGVIALAGCSQAIARVAGRPQTRMIAAAFLLAGSLPLGFLARQHASHFLPCAFHVVAEDQSARGWWIVPDEIRAWMDVRAEACREGRDPPPLVSLPVVTWGLHDEGRDASADGFRWTRDRVVMLLPTTANAVSLAVRREDATPARAVRVAIRHGGRTQTIVLDSAEPRSTSVGLVPDLLTRIRRSHRVDIEVLDWFVPAVRDPRSQDLRRFGVELRVFP